jgi:hypothetical protein
MLNEDEKIKYVIGQMSVERYPNVYFIGRCASRLTFVSQQYRALNLVWALQKTGQLKPRTEVTIVGAGLAGLTAAYAAYHLDASVTLIESKTEAMHIQRGCEQRFIHPYILDWPEPDSEEKSFTDFPCLNWGAGMAAQVCNTVIEQWLSVEGIIKPKYGFEVREIKIGENNKPFIICEGKEKNYRKHCDILILAIGFGLERTLPSVPFLSYWENDNFGRPVITGKVPRTYFVTGCGDGGLIDAIRLRIRNFNHAYFIYDLKGMDGLEKIKERLPEIDKEVLEKLNHEDSEAQIKKEIELINANDPYIKRYFKNDISSELFARESVASTFLEDAYNELEIPDDLIRNLQLRQDTIVYLNSPYPSPLTLRSSVLNRFVIFLLRKYGHMRYRQGWVEVSKANVTQPYNVLIRSYNYPVEVLEVDDVVSRHGPNHAVDKLFPKTVAEACRQTSPSLEDYSRAQLYDEKFLDLPVLKKEKQKVRLEYAVSRLPEAVGSFKKDFEYSRYGIKIEDGKISYYITLNESNISQRKNSFYEFDLEFEQVEKQEFLPIKQPFKLFCYGAGVRRLGNSIEQKHQKNLLESGLSTICCFVKSLENGQIGLLTVANSLSNPQELHIGHSIALANINSPIQSETATITHLNLAMPSNLQANLVTDTIRFNRYDAVIAELNCQTNYSPKYLSEEPLPTIKHLFNLPETEAVILRGRKIFKVGAASGLTRGIIEEISVSAKIYKWGEQFWYERLIRIVGINGVPFAKYGDEGAGIIDEDGQLIGMLIDSVNDKSYACFIQPILSNSGYELFLPS